MKHLFCFGLGYSGRALGKSLLQDGWKVSGTTRNLKKVKRLEKEGFNPFLFPGEECLVEDQLSSTTHLLITIPPQSHGDIVNLEYSKILASQNKIKWLGYLSSTGVYGNRDGAWVDEESKVLPENPRSLLRVEAERQWLEFGEKNKINLNIFRAAGIYGNGRNILETVKAGKAKRIQKKGQISNRIHVEDLVSVLVASIDRDQSTTIYNVCDDESASSKEVLEFACHLLKVEPPPVIPFHKAKLSKIARIFYLENKRICNNRIKNLLNIKLKYPNYRCGLSAVFETLKVDT